MANDSIINYDVNSMYPSDMTIDWGTSDATSVTYTSGTTYDAGVVYTPYQPLTVTNGATSGTITFDWNPPVTYNGEFRICFDDYKGKFNYIEPEDHFIGHEDLFEI